jgi:hypothetical protein
LVLSILLCVIVVVDQLIVADRLVAYIAENVVLVIAELILLATSQIIPYILSI